METVQKVMIKMHFSGRFLVMLFAMLTRLEAQAPHGAHKVDLDIPSQSLDKALTELGKQADLTIIVPLGTGAEQLKSRRLQGPFFPEEALHELLGKSGLRAEWDPEVGFIIKRSEKKITPLPAKPRGDKDPPTEEVSITASRIDGVPPDISPVDTYSHDDLDSSGVITMQQFVRTIPQNFALLNPETSTGSGIISPVTATNVLRDAGFNLGGLNPSATLVLVDGEPTAPGGYDGSSTGVSMIPLVAVDHVDVLNNGASSVYGSDAVAGVVNILTWPDFEGAQVTGYYGYTPRGGGSEQAGSLLAGHRWPINDAWPTNGKWSNNGFMVAFEKHRQGAVDASSRPTLVPQPALYQAIPFQDYRSTYLKVHQAVTAGTELKAHAHYSERNVDQTYLSIPAVPTQSVGYAKALGGGLTAVQMLPGDWCTELIGTYDRREETLTQSVAMVTQPFETRSSVTSVDWRGNGPVVSLPGGLLKFSSGTSWRYDAFNNLLAPLGPTGSGLKRRVLGFYGEAFVPVVGKSNTLPGIKRLELLIAIRHDDYHNGEARIANASADSPRINLLLSPLEDLLFQAGYTQSFRVASEWQAGSASTALLAPLATPAGTINTLYITGANPLLRPEFAKSFTLGVDYSPKMWEGTSLAMTYFAVRYNNRIATPLVIGPLSSIFSQLGALAPFVNTAPSAADIQKIYDDHVVLDPTEIGKARVEAIFYSQLQNIAKTQESGVDLLARWRKQFGFGELRFSMKGEYLATLRNQTAPTTSFESVANTPFSPTRFRMQTTTGWSMKSPVGDWAVSATFDQTGSYRDTLSPGAPHVGSWLTIDLRVAYSTESSFEASVLSNLTVAVYAFNVADRPVPYVGGLRDLTLGYNPASAAVLGRQIRFELTKWF